MSLTDDQWAGIQAQFLRFVQLVSSLEANPAKKTVLLPLSEEQLLATGESSLSADFTVNERRGEMTLRPFEPDGTRMGMKLKSLLCPIAISCSSVTDDPDGPWSDSLPSLLANCRGLRVFMVNYVHDLNPRSRARSGILTDLVGETP
jgi:hypothetical protein